MALFPPNLILYVPVGGVSLTEDKYGNPVESTPTEAAYLFSVVENSPNLKANVGLDTATATYTGRCVGKVKDLEATNVLANDNIDTRQKYLPTNIIPNTKLRCESVEVYTPEVQSGNLANSEKTKKHRGIFVVLSAFQSRYKVVTKVLGTKLVGYFELGR